MATIHTEEDKPEGAIARPRSNSLSEVLTKGLSAGAYVASTGAETLAAGFAGLAVLGLLGTLYRKSLEGLSSEAVEAEEATMTGNAEGVSRCNTAVTAVTNTHSPTTTHTSPSNSGTGKRAGRSTKRGRTWRTACCGQFSLA